MLVTGIGMVTPVGWDAPRSCAAIRAGISMFREVKGIVDVAGEPVLAAQIAERPSTEWSDADARDVARQACEQALAEWTGIDRGRQRGTLSVVVGEYWPPNARIASVEFARQLGGTLGLTAIQPVVLDQGNAAGVAALSDAANRLRALPEGIELIVGFDSLVRIEALRRLECAGRLKSSRQPRGLIPGEACAAVLLRSDRTTSRQPPLCRVLSAATAREPAPVASDEPCLGRGLTEAVGAAMTAAKWSRDDVARIYCDLNGESYRGHEWALTLCRRLASPEVTHPADCVGDVGAAFVPLLIGMAATAFHRGYARADKALLFCGSDSGLRGAVCLAAP